MTPPDQPTPPPDQPAPPPDRPTPPPHAPTPAPHTGPTAPPTPALTRAALRAVLVRPTLWPAAAAAAIRLAEPGWWRHWPPRPVPAAGYWHFRLVTAYGGEGSDVPTPEDLVEFLQWCRRMRNARTADG